MCGHSRNRIKTKTKMLVLDRDHGCVFCKVGYRPERHIPCYNYDMHFYGGKAYACCEYHAQFLSPEFARIPELGKMRDEMHAILDEYLKYKDDPEVFW